ncbi:MAG: hypothetical protein WCJ84_03740 [Candidatus Peregrinibacteria bacterium]
MRNIFFSLLPAVFIWGVFSCSNAALAMGTQNIPETREKTETIGVSQVQVSPPGGSFSVGQTVTLTAPKGMRIFWTLHPKRAKEAGRVSEGNTASITLSRSGDLGVYAWDTETGKETPMEIFSFRIESPYENEYFRFHALDPNPQPEFVPTITLINASEFSLSLDGWKIISPENGSEILLPDEEMEAGEIRRFVYPLSPRSGKVYLVSPSGIKKDVVFYQDLDSSYFLERAPQKGRLDKRPAFRIIQHTVE